MYLRPGRRCYTVTARASRAGVDLQRLRTRRRVLLTSSLPIALAAHCLLPAETRSGDGGDRVAPTFRL